MKGILPLFCSLLLLQNASAQKFGSRDYEIGLSSGMSWYNGDLNPNTQFNRDLMDMAYGLSIRKNLNSRFALRLNAIYTRLSGDDVLIRNPMHQQRNLNFSSELYEGSMSIEFNFFEFDALIPGKKITCYNFFGLGAFHFSPETTIEGNVYELRPLRTEGVSYGTVAATALFGVGVKWAPSDRILVSGEYGIRRTFTDYLDDVSDVYPDPQELNSLAQDISDRSLVKLNDDGTNWGTQRGNPATKDWYTVVRLTLGVRIGPKKGSCKNVIN